MNNPEKWETYDKEAVVVEYVRQRRQRLIDSIGEFLSDDEATVEEMVEVIRDEILDWQMYYNKGASKCEAALEAMREL